MTKIADIRSSDRGWIKIVRSSDRGRIEIAGSSDRESDRRIQIVGSRSSDCRIVGSKVGSSDRSSDRRIDHRIITVRLFQFVNSSRHLLIVASSFTRRNFCLAESRHFVSSASFTIETCLKSWRHRDISLPWRHRDIS